jgi:REP element-mobilizing transposase RayT
MPRKPREEIVDGIFHVYARGNNKGLIYRDGVDRQAYLQALGAVVERCRWRLLAFCLMDNHMHLLVETPAREPWRRDAAASERLRAAVQPAAWALGARLSGAVRLRSRGDG